MNLQPSTSYVSPCHGAARLSFGAARCGAPQRRHGAAFDRGVATGGAGQFVRHHRGLRGDDVAGWLGCIPSREWSHIPPGEKETHLQRVFSGWWQLKYFLFSTPIPWGRWTQFDGCIFFRWVGKNHQPGWFWENFPGSWFWRYIIIVSFQKMLGDFIYYNIFNFQQLETAFIYKSLFGGHWVDDNVLFQWMTFCKSTVPYLDGYVSCMWLRFEPSCFL